MMIITDELLDENNIDQSFISKINSMFKDKYEEITGKEFEKLYNFVEPELFEINKTKMLETTYKKLIKNIARVKSNWVKIYMNNKDTDEYKAIQNAEYNYDKVLAGELTLESFGYLFKGCNNVDEYKKFVYGNILDWKNSKDSLLSNYKHLKTLSSRAITSAFKNDILRLYIKHKSSKDITVIPKFTANLPFDPTNKKRFLTVEEQNDIKNNLAFSGSIKRVIENSFNEQFIIELEKETYLRIKSGKNAEDLIAQIALFDAIKSFNNNDLLVMAYYYSNPYNLIKDEPIINTIGEIVRGIGLKGSKYDYENVENSLRKIGSIKLTSPTFGKTSVSATILDVTIEEVGKKTYAKVRLGGTMKDLVKMGEAFSFDTEVFNKLSAAAQQTAIYLQDRRLRLAATKGVSVENVYIDEIAKMLYITTSSIYKKRDIVLSVIEELKQAKLIVKNGEYQKKGYVVIMEYYKLPNYILQKMKNNQFKSSDLIEGADFIVE